MPRQVKRAVAALHDRYASTAPRSLHRGDDALVAAVRAGFGALRRRGGLGCGAICAYMADAAAQRLDGQPGDECLPDASLAASLAHADACGERWRGMTEGAMSEELNWDHAAAGHPGGRASTVERAATAKERAAIARRSTSSPAPSLVARYTITPRSDGHFRLTGTLAGTVEQTCVVTLEPLTNDVARDLRVDFWPETEYARAERRRSRRDDEPDMEPIVAGRIEVGRIVFECLAGAIDLFPRKPGATFERRPTEGGGRPSPRGLSPHWPRSRPKRVTGRA